MSKIEVNTVDVASGSTLTLGSSGKTIALASGTTNSINVKDIDWQTVVSTDTTMVSGRGYFVDSSGGTKTMTLPASPSVGDRVAVVALDGATNAVTIARNGSNIEGSTNNLSLQVNYAVTELSFTDASNGWVRTTKIGEITYITATGGTESTSGDYKIHTFNSSSNFVVTEASSSNHTAEYLVVAAGGGGGASGGGAGAGGFRTNYPSPDTGGVTISAQTYPITVGAGGTGTPGSATSGTGNAGGSSTFSTITSAGGGGGAAHSGCPGANGGSVGGGGREGGQPG